MNCWDELEIEATDDVKSIKRAYARKLKTIDRANEIDAFQRLRSAYDQACYQVTTDSDDTAIELTETSSTNDSSVMNRVVPENPTPSQVLVSPHNPDATEDQLLGASADDALTHDPSLVWPRVDAYLTQVDELLKNDELKYSEAAWEPLWHHDAFESLHTKEILYEELFEYLIRMTPSVDAITAGDNFMPEFVLPRFDTLFSWRTDEIRLAERFDEDDVDRMLLLSSHQRIQSKLQSAEQGTINFGKVYLWATVLIIVAMFIKSRFF